MGFSDDLPSPMEAGNIDLANRPRLKNEDGSESTISSISFNQDGQEILVPTIVNGKRVSEDEAVAEYNRTGKHLGKFKTPDEATNYAKRLSERQGRAPDLIPELPRMLQMGSLSLDAPAQQQAPSYLGQFAAGFSRQNEIVSFFSRKDLGVDNSRDPTYDPWQDIKGTEFEGNWESFALANNAKYANALKQQLLMERNQTRTLEASGFVGTLGEILGGVASPLTFVPGGGLVKAVRGGYSVVSSGLRVGAMAAATTAAQEGLLQGLQETRTASESIEAIGFSFVLGGLLGGGIAGLLNKGEVARAERGFRQLDQTFSQPEGVPKGLGADANATIEYTRGDLGAAGRLTSAMIETIHDVNPGLAMMTNAIPEVRLGGQMLTETPTYTNMNMAKDSVGPAVETLVRMNVSARLAQAVTEQDKAFRDMKKAGVRMSKGDFEDAVGRAMRRGDTDPNPHVERAAQAYRSKIFEPWKQEAIANGLMPADVTPAGALSYFSRMYNRKMLIAQEFQFKDLVRPDVEKLVQKSYTDNVEEVNLKVRELERDIQELGLEGISRTDALADIEAAIQRADMEHPEAVAAREDLKELRAQASRLKKEGKVEEAQEAQRLANEISDRTKDLRKKYNEAVRPMMRSRKNIEQGVGSMAEEADKIRGQLIDAEEAQLRSLQRVVSQGRKVEREIGQIDRIDLEDKIGKLKESFTDLGGKFDNAAAQTRSIIDKMKADAEQALKDRRLAQYSPEGTFKAIQEMNKVDVEAAAKRNEMVKKLEKIEEQQRARSARMDAISKRLEETESIDLTEMRNAVKAATDELLAEVNATMSKRSERMLRLMEKLQESDPAKVKAVQALRQGQIDRVKSRFFSKWEGVNAKLDGGQPALKGVVDDIVNDYFEKISGRDKFGDHSNLPEYATSVTKGPLKDRTVWVREEIVEPFLENNVRMVAERYARTMAAEIELTQRIGSAKADELFGEFGTFRSGAERLRNQVNEAKTLEEIKDITGKSFGKDLAKAKESALTYINNQLEEGLRYGNSLRDILRRSYKAEAQSTNWGRIVKALNMFNYIRLSGGFGITSLNDVFMPAISHGIRPYIGEGVVPLVKQLEGAKLSVAEAKLAGLVVERVNQHRMMALMEINDRFADHTPIERMLSNMSALASKFNGLQYTQDFGEAVGSILSQNRIINSVKGGTNGELMALLGMKPSMAGRLKDQIDKFAQQNDGVWVANTLSWTDTEAVRLYRAMTSKDVTSTVVRPGIAEKPLWGHTPIGQAILQFLPFQLAANQRIMMRGMQEGQARFVSGMAALSGIGVGIAYLKSLSQGKEAHEKFMKNAQNPGWLIAEGLDASGLLTLPFMVSNDIEKATKVMGNPFNPIKTPLQAAGGEMPESTNPFNQSMLRSMVGPSFGLPDDLARTTGAGINWLRGKDVTDAHLKGVQYMLPFGTFTGVRDAMQALRGDHVMQR